MKIEFTSSFGDEQGQTMVISAKDKHEAEVATRFFQSAPNLKATPAGETQDGVPMQWRLRSEGEKK